MHALLDVCAGICIGFLGICVYTCVHTPVMCRAGPQGLREVRGSHPLIVDSEVVVEVDDALGLAQEAAVGGLCPPVQQVARAVILPPYGERAGWTETDPHSQSPGFEDRGALWSFNQPITTLPPTAAILSAQRPHPSRRSHGSARAR